MKDILIIAPYKELYDVCTAVIEKNNYENVSVVVADTDGTVDFRELMLAHKPLVVISRGGVYSTVKKLSSTIAFVEMRIGAYDIVNSIKDIFSLEESVAVLGFDNITYGFEVLQSIKNFNIVKVNREAGEDIKTTVQKCAANNIKVFMGDARVSKACAALGYKCYMIKSGEEAVITAIEKANEIIKITKDQMEKNERYVALMDCVHDGVIATDNENRITTCNYIAESILGIDRNELIGKHLSELFDSKGNNLFNPDNSGAYDGIRKINGISITLNQIPIKVLGEIKGYVSVFQDVKKLQKFEQKVRTQLLGKGFKAKYTFDDIITDSERMKKSIEKAKKFSQYDASILIQGSSGVGKELFAQSIHNLSPRKKGPFVAINCGALPESIIESELFGYEEGAFTGSKKGGRAGVFEMAHRGTIFLDEISEIPLNIQSQLLRVIQEREIMRLGDNKVIPLDIRIICATNKDLKKMVEEGRFREDLFYRINTLGFSIPVLKERAEDIALLANHYRHRFCVKYGKEIEGYTKEAMDFLKNSQFRGNVRELQNLIERSVILCGGSLIGLEDFEDEIDIGGIQEAATAPIGEKFKDELSLKEFEKEYINYVFEKENGSVKRVCEILKIDRSTLWRKLKEKQE